MRQEFKPCLITLLIENWRKESKGSNHFLEVELNSGKVYDSRQEVNVEPANVDV